ncbi:cellulase family glycosylhydrolase [Candidatus Bipolaricaulota bacterium]|nr:cellulase family glycosylhydrolase [Candidatus Bipolaricaulota bacterium]
MSEDKCSRRDFLKATLTGSSALAAPTIINYLGQSSPSSDKEFLEIRDGNFYMGGEEYVIKGANYITRDHPWRMFDEYDPEQIDKELEMASQLGINTVRAPIRLIRAIGHVEPYSEPIEHNEPEEDFFDNFEDFLGLADRHNIKVMPIAIGMEYHEYYNPKRHHLSEEYLEKWLPEFKDDERILAWDVKNEPDIKEEELREAGTADRQKVVEYTNKMAEKIQSLDPNHPVTIGLSDTHGESPAIENLINELPKYIDHEDFYSFHCYKPAKYLDSILKKIKRQTAKPVVLQEFGWPSQGKDTNGGVYQRKRYQRTLEFVQRKGINGAMFWEFNDHPNEAIEDSEPEWLYHMGVFRTDYSKKPAAHVVEQYYNWIF